jgi:hypothetical protein
MRRFHGPVPPIDSPAGKLGFFPRLDDRQSRTGGGARLHAGGHGHCWATAVRWCSAWTSEGPQRLHDAYNDAAGVTAAFTLNLLRRMTRELHATFDLGAFAHEAVLQRRRKPDRDLPVAACASSR